MAAPDFGVASVVLLSDHHTTIEGMAEQANQSIIPFRVVMESNWIWE